MITDDTAHAPADLTIEVYTTPGRPFTSAATPEGPGDLPNWSPSSATLVYGEHGAILVDTLITYDQVDALADWIDTKGRRLSRIYITHGHGDHWLGLARLIQRFPGATGLATAEVLAQAADPAMADYWEAVFPGEIPKGAEKVLPQLLTADTLDLQKRIDGLTVAPKDVVGGAADLIEEVASKKITGEEDRYSRTDLWDFQANVDGAQKIVTLLNPLIVKQDPKLSARLHDNFAKVDVLLAKYRTKDGGFESYEKLSDHDRTAFKGPVTALAEDLSALKGTLGVE